MRDCLSTESSQHQEECHRESGEAMAFGSPPCTPTSPLAHELPTDALTGRTPQLTLCRFSQALLLSQEAWLALAKFSHQCFLASSSC